MTSPSVMATSPPPTSNIGAMIGGMGGAFSVIIILIIIGIIVLAIVGAVCLQNRRQTYQFEHEESKRYVKTTPTKEELMNTRYTPGPIYQTVTNPEPYAIVHSDTHNQNQLVTESAQDYEVPESLSSSQQLTQPPPLYAQIHQSNTHIVPSNGNLPAYAEPIQLNPHREPNPYSEPIRDKQQTASGAPIYFVLENCQPASNGNVIDDEHQKVENDNINKQPVYFELEKPNQPAKDNEIYSVISNN
jgi:FtsZ-interacting cell division protein ZipA